MASSGIHPREVKADQGSLAVRGPMLLDDEGGFRPHGVLIDNHGVLTKIIGWLNSG